MTFSLSKKDFNILKKFDCGFDHVKNIQSRNGEILFEVDDVDDFQFDMTSDIIHIGMDNQDTVNELGIEMYRIHDILMYSKKSL